MGPLGDRGPFHGGADVVTEGLGGVRLVSTAWPGSADGTPALLLHGLSQQRRFWGPVVSRWVGGPLAATDQRGHGDSAKPDHGAYDIATCADDVPAVLDALGWSEAVVVGHSWGASVALAAAARHPDRVASVVAIDGGVVSLADLGPREEVRRLLTPPRLGLPADDLVPLLSTGSLAPWWGEETEAALLPTFEVDAEGRVRTRLGFDRHLLVLDGMLDHDVDATLAAVRCPAWVVSCEPVGAAPPAPPSGDGGPHADAAWARARAAGLDRAARLLRRPRLLRWAGAVHDVPLQWPALVAGLVRSAVDEGGPM